jgi:hypothetical protein
VIVGKRALPALDVSILFAPWLHAIVSGHSDGLRKAAESNIQAVRPGMPVLRVSAKTGQGLDK